MPVVRAQVELAHDSGLPRDKTINTFHFNVPDLADATLNPVANELVQFYTEDNGASQANALMNYISTAVADGGHRVKFYDLGTPGSPPEYEFPFDFLGRAPVGVGSGNAPGEVAVCLSFRNESIVAINPRRRRGRIYFGPIRNGATNFADAAEPAPSAALVADLLVRADELRNDIAAMSPDHSWVIYSRAQAMTFDVERAWVDNAFDTQRRRGIRATSRTWSPAL